METTTGTPEPRSRYRWMICGLLLAAIAINYTHRQMIGILKDPLSAEMGWDENDYAGMVMAFQAAYALGYVAWGRVLDKIGARIGYTIAFVVWTLAHMLTGAVTTSAQFMVTRAGPGPGRIRQLPVQPESRRRMVPAEGTRPGRRYLQRRFQYRRHPRTAAGADDRAVRRQLQFRP